PLELCLRSAARENDEHGHHQQAAAEIRRHRLLRQVKAVDAAVHVRSVGMNLLGGSQHHVGAGAVYGNEELEHIVFIGRAESQRGQRAAASLLENRGVALDEHRVELTEEILAACLHLVERIAIQTRRIVGVGDAAKDVDI